MHCIIKTEKRWRYILEWTNGLLLSHQQSMSQYSYLTTTLQEQWSKKENLFKLIFRVYEAKKITLTLIRWKLIQSFSAITAPLQGLRSTQRTNLPKSFETSRIGYRSWRRGTQTHCAQETRRLSTQEGMGSSLVVFSWSCLVLCPNSLGCPQGTDSTETNG